MARLPQPGADSGTWGDILNDFLATVHKTDGSLKDNSVTAAALAPSAVTAAGISNGTITEAKLDSLLAAKVNAGAGGTIADASPTVKGLVQLAGDLSGTAAAPTVPGLAAKLDASQKGAANGVASLDATGKVPSSQLPASSAGVDSVNTRTGAVTLTATDVGLGNVNNTSDANKPISSATQTALNGKADTAHSHTLDSLSDVTASGATDGQSLVYNAGAWAPGTVGSGGSVSDATTSAKGVVQLAGDLAGTAASPQVAKLNGVAVSGTPSAGQVLTATGAAAASWQAASGGGGSSFTFSSISADATAANNNYLLVDTTSVGVTVTLPVAVSGGKVRIKRMTGGSNSVQILPQAPALIDGSGVGSHVLGNQWDSMEFVSDGTNWYRG